MFKLFNIKTIKKSKIIILLFINNTKEIHVLKLYHLYLQN